MLTINEYEGDLQKYKDRYEYQESLTDRLDNIEKRPFNQSLLNEIVLWKVNRFVELDNDIFREINELKELTSGEHKKGEHVLKHLIGSNGIDLPLASSILRFRNPKVFQIIDRHAYRAVYGEKYPLYTKTSPERKINLYFDYLNKLVDLCNANNLDFEKIDRVLYQFDKGENGKL